MKGVLSLRGDSNRFIFQGVHMTLDTTVGAAWGKTPRVNKLIFIGKNLDRAALNDGFQACLASCPLAAWRSPPRASVPKPSLFRFDRVQQ